MSYYILNSNSNYSTLSIVICKTILREWKACCRGKAVSKLNFKCDETQLTTCRTTKTKQNSQTEIIINQSYFALSSYPNWQKDFIDPLQRVHDKKLLHWKTTGGYFFIIFWIN
jgi:hypothetical protein